MPAKAAFRYLAYIWLASLTLILLFNCRAVQSQEYVLNFSLLDKEGGLWDNSYNSFITKDSRGFIWMSSLNGCFRFDGLDITHYPVNGPTADQFVQSSFWEDTLGRIWFTTYYEGLHYYDPQNDRIVTPHAFMLPLNDGGGVRNDEEYHVFYLDRNEGWLWLRAGDFIWRYHVYLNKAEKIATTIGKRFAVRKLKDGYGFLVIACPMIGSDNIEIFHVKQSTLVGKKSVNSDKISNKPISVRHAVFQSDSLAWLFSDHGLLALNVTSGEIIQRYQPSGIPDFTCWDGDFLPNSPQLLISAPGYGLWCFDTDHKAFSQQWHHEAGVKSSLLNNNPHELYIDPDNNLWLSHDLMGVAYSAIAAKQFFDPLERHPAYANVEISFLAEDREGKIWAVSKNKRLFVFSLEGDLLATSDQLYGNRNFKFLNADARGNLWLIVGNSIFRYSYGQHSWREIIAAPYDIVSLYHGIDGRILVISTVGILELVEENKVYRLVRAPEFDAYRDFSFFQFFSVGNNKVLLPFRSQALWIAQQEKAVFEIIDTLFLNALTYGGFSFDGGSTIWLSTSKGLLQYTNGGNWMEEVFSEQSKEHLQPTSIIGDKSGQLWLGSKEGLWNYNPSTKKVVNYSSRHGLPTEMFPEYAALAASDGRIWMGTNNGLTVFHPDSIRYGATSPIVFFEGLWVNNLPYKSETALDRLPFLRLNYLENTLTFKLKAIGADRPEDNQVNYRLSGYDEQAVTISNGGYARFTQIPPGNYVLEVTALDANGLPGETRSLAILIPPPFWQTLWFRLAVALAYIALIAGAVGLYYRRRLQQQRRLLERQAALQAERDRIARELHDDLGGELSSILFISEDLSFEQEDQAGDERVIRISQLARHSLENMREIVWALDTRKDSVEDLVARLRAFLLHFTTDNKLALKLDFPAGELPNIVLGGERRRNIYLIVKECLHNVVKHAKATKVEVKLVLLEGNLRIDVRDDGRGFDPATARPEGNGLGNMQQRAAAIGGTLTISSTRGQGTVASLVAPLEHRNME